MKNSKLILLLRTFNKQEFKSFQDFVHSPYFNSKSDLKRFCDFLLDKVPTIVEIDLDKTSVYQTIFPDKAFNDKHFGYLMSDMCKLVERFLKLKKFEASNVSGDLKLLQSYLDRRLLKLYDREYSRIVQKISKIEKRDAEFFLNNYQLSESALQHFNLLQKRQHNLHLQETADNLDKFYFASKLKHSCSMINNQKILATSYDLNLLDEIQYYLSKTENDQEPAIALYHLTVEMLWNEDKAENFFLLRDLIYQQSHLLKQSDAQYIYISAINFCARRIKKGEKHFDKEALDLFLDAIEKEILYENGVLSPWVFKNIIQLALDLKDDEWIEDFIRNYTGKLAREFQENALHFNLANLFYRQKNYDQSMDHLNQIEYTDIYYNFDSKVMLIKIYFELDEIEPLTSLLASFSLFLKRNKSVSKNNKAGYSNFCGFMNRILRKKPERKEKILNAIEETQFLMERSWLIEQINTHLN